MKPGLMLGIPNSGTSWLGECIGKHLRGGKKYYREYFNPALCPREHELTLGGHFGSEIVSYYRNIADPAGPGFDSAVQRTWFQQDEFGFTKDVFNPFKLEGFTRHFNCFVLVRDVLESWPPSRGRVYAFYDAIWHALDCAGGWSLRGGDIYGRCDEARDIIDSSLISSARDLNVPIIDYSLLFDERARVLEALQPIQPYADAGAVANEIVATRKRHPRKRWVEGAA